jgi:hypothetical protein
MVGPLDKPLMLAEDLPADPPHPAPAARTLAAAQASAASAALIPEFRSTS